ncbi:hypothetical protein DLAC_04064 [Tieghemostelium lacteum]|uniref:S-adenosyl-L-methionine-dependent methyltransferase n=1 Tax=Tieghemostelium lacteum TaxID=361077 RepID=A0A151ZS40_TIELA|nr:hypothetical protein DLAC_04064 [Tieghemostelium lacteum]|eukprot:KYQ96766.1 hypothetical protein DLAC_04064 [Tieghemostelium lacteum]
MEMNSMVKGVGRTSILISALRFIVTNNYVVAANSGKLKINSVELEESIKKYSKDVQVLEDKNEYPFVYDPYCFYYLNTPDAKLYLMETLLSVLEEPEKKDEAIKFIQESPLIVSWNKVAEYENKLDIALRTKYIDDWVLSNLHFKQMVVLGAGLDSRPRRLPLPSHMKVFELDLPHVMSFRDRILENIPLKPLSKCGIIPVSVNLLTEDWAQKLIDKGYSKDEPTLWLVEGLVMYFTEAQNDFLFRTLNSLSTKGSKQMLLTVSPKIQRFDTNYHAERPINNLGFKKYNWSSIVSEFISRHEDPMGLISKYGFSNDLKSLHANDIAKLYNSNLVSLAVTYYTTGEK